MRNLERNASIIEAYLTFGQAGASQALGIPRSIIAGVVHRAGVTKNPTGPRLNAANNNTALVSLSTANGKRCYYDPSKGGRYIHHDEPQER